MYRVEDKYFLSDSEMLLLEKRISKILKPDAYSIDGSYKISSLYFDDYFNSSYEDVADGVDDRRKYRVRIYNDSLEVIKLEIKEKKYGCIRKHSCSINKEQLKRLISGNTLESDSKNETVDMFNVTIKAGLLRPKVIVTYDRSAYIYKAGNVRITFDRGLRASKKIGSFVCGESDKYSIKLSTAMECGNVLEVKYDEFLPEFIADTLEYGNMIQTSYSKYRMCRDMIL